MLVVHNSGAEATRYVEQMIRAPPQITAELRRVLGSR
jgi:hypothetical protein